MIIEIIVLLGFLGSLTGLIFFVKHYFKTWKERSDNKKMLLAIESADDEYAGSDRFYSNILDKIDFSKVGVYILVVSLVIIGFSFFASSNNEPSTGNQGVSQGPAIIQAQGGGGAPVSTPSTPSINDSSNMSITDFFPGFLKDSKGGISFWFFILAGGLMFWVMSRIIRNHSYL